MVALLNGEAGDATGEAREQQTRGFDLDVADVKELRRGRTSRCRTAEDGVSGEERRKHHDVGQQEYPEPVADVWAQVHLRRARWRAHFRRSLGRRSSTAGEEGSR